MHRDVINFSLAVRVSPSARAFHSSIFVQRSRRLTRCRAQRTPAQRWKNGMREPKEKHEPREKSYQKVVLSMRFLGLREREREVFLEFDCDKGPRHEVSSDAHPDYLAHFGVRRLLRCTKMEEWNARAEGETRTAREKLPKGCAPKPCSRRTSY
jgi:hypothetical protein